MKNKTEKIQVRMTYLELQLLKAKAKANGMTVTDFIISETNRRKSQSPLNLN